MLRSFRLLSVSLALIGSFLLPLPYGYTETNLVVPVVVPVRSRNAAEAGAVHEVAVGLAETAGVPHRVLPARAAQPAAIQVMEPSRRFTLEELRRSMVLYPDHDLAGRLWEIGTQRPPLFGEDE